MKIALIGWYGHGNAGDDRIGQCMEKFLGGRGHRCDLFDAFAFLDLPEAEINAYDYVLFGGGGLINHNQNKKVKKLDRVRCRFSCIGISIDGVFPDNKKFVDALLAKSEFFMVRDGDSYDMTKPHDKAIDSHDLTFLDPFPMVDLSKLSMDKCGLNLRDWPFWNLEFHSFWDRKFRRWNLQKFSDRYPFTKHDPRLVMGIVREHFREVHGISFYAPKNSRAKSDATVLSSAGVTTTTAEFDGAMMHDFAVQIGMRFHHLAFCVQMGIPCINLIYQGKSASLLDRIGCPALGVDIHHLEQQLPSAIDFLKNHHEQIRRNFLSYRNCAQAELLTTMEKVAHLIETPAQTGKIS